MTQALRFYIATKLERADDHNVVRDALHDIGHRITYDWTVHGSVKNDGVKRIAEVAVLEKQGVLDADYVVVLLPGGRGTHAELGMALAANKPVFAHADPKHKFFGSSEATSAFYHDPLVHPYECPVSVFVIRIMDWAELLQPDGG